MKELNESMMKATAATPGNILLDVVPILRHPWFPPYSRLMEFRKRQKDIYDRIICPALVSRPERGSSYCYVYFKCIIEYDISTPDGQKVVSWS